MSKTLYLIRGLPNTGKTTLARILAPDHNAAADDFFMDENGAYKFDIKNIETVHEQCFERVKAWMEQRIETIAVHNTFSQPWEAEPYMDLAYWLDYQVIVIECQTQDLPKNGHEVPLRVIDAMRARWLPLY